MKQTLTLLSAVFISISTFAQITITAADIPMFRNVYNVNVLDPMPLPAIGSNLVWDYSGYTYASQTTNNYPTVTDTFFTHRGGDVSNATTKLFGNMGLAQFTNEVDQIWDLDSTGFYIRGLFVPGGTTDFGPFGGSSADSIGGPDLKYILSPPVTLMKFPMTLHSSWHTICPMQIDMMLTLHYLGLDHAALQQRYTYYRTDSIVGFGKMTVYTAQGPSTAIDVLVRKTEQYTIDSFFVNGSPASQGVMDTFNLQQHSYTDLGHFYDFLRKGDSKFLMRFNYSDSTFTTMTSAFECTDGVLPLGISDLNSGTYSVLVYPNPSNSGEFNVSVSGRSVVDPTYIISDLTGRVVEQGQATVGEKGLIKIAAQHTLTNGDYVISVTDQSGKKILAEQVSHQR